MTNVMRDIASDVRFDHAAAQLLARRCRTAATLIDGQAGSRASWVQHGLEDFQGYYSQLFGQNGSVQASDATLLASRLREVAAGADQLAREAASEQERRETARAWKQRMDDRGLWDHIVDLVTGEEDPPVGPAARPVSLSFAQAQTGAREPLRGSGSTGTSSARPANLRAFASNSAGANETLAAHPGLLRSAYDSFVAGCGWGSLSADGVWAGFDQYLAANGTDVHWANTVAAAFESAGGEGVVTVATAAITQSLAASGVNAERADLQIDPPQAYGAPPTTGYANDPVNTATGNFLEPECDLAFPGAAASLTLTRMYNSLDPGTGAFGPGWSSWTEAGLRLADDAARWVLHDGREVVFPRQGTGWGRATTEAYWLDATPSGFVATDNAGGTWEFDRAGALASLHRGPGTRVDLRRKGGRLVGLVHERGRSIELTWAGGRVVGAAASDGRRVAYAYDEAGRLVAASGPLGTRTYRWNAAGLVDQVTDGDGVVEATNTYDDLGRVSTQISRHGRLTRFTYLPGRVTLVDDPDGSRHNTWIHDRQGRLVGVVDAHDRRQSTAYDRHGNAVMVTARDGSVTLAEFDDRGRRTAQVLPSGGRIDTTWDDADRVVEVTVGASGTTATTRLAYEGASPNPGSLTDPEGGVTRLEWDGNLLLAAVDPTGVRVSHGYDPAGDLVSTTNADGHTALLERDAAGRVTSATTPGGHRTTFAWDERGLLASRTDPDGGVWRFEHTTAGRLSATIDPYGARSEVAHDAAGEAASATDALGRTLHRVFDDLGNLASVTLPDGSRWGYTHDALSRLVAATDPDGHTWRREYDDNGLLTSVIDPTGRPASAVAPEGSVARLDRCGRPVAHTDALGHTTTLRRDIAGRVVEVARPDGTSSRFGYDACGRLASATDALGATTTFSYDPDGRLAAQTDPTGAVTTSAYDGCGRLVERTAPAAGRTTWAYDRAGRLVRTRDPLWGARSFTYDAAGQLVAATNPLGGVTRYAYDDLGRMVTITDPLGNVTRRGYNGRSKVVRSVDPLGRVTEGGYDGAGRPTWQLEPTGDRLEWGYDEAGRLASMGVDGAVHATFEHDVATGTLTALDHTDPSAPVRHTVRRDAAGHIVERSRDGRSTRWERDALGRCTAVVTPTGIRSRYRYDAAGRLAALTTEGVGSVQLTRDATGRLTGARAGDLAQAWAWSDGHVVGHTLSGAGAASETVVVRDDAGRINEITRDGVTTGYSYDEAGQLVEAVGDAGRHTWVWDEAGRLLAESDGVRETTYGYDAAGQLVARQAPEGATAYSYDANGRRTTADGPGGRLEYSWGAFGWLAQVASPAGVTQVHVDALGELARVDDTELFWDSATPQGLPLQVGPDAVLTAGGFTATPAGWDADGWRTARPTGSDPWAQAAPAASGVAVTGVAVTAGGQVNVAGLEWLGARAYEPETRGFLSVDPLPPVAGTGWGGNPYSYAGNDPLHAVDPSGLRPVTDAELQAYRDSNNGFLAAAGDWLSNNWEYLAGGAMVIAGGVMVATGFGGPVGVALIAAGADTIIQKATTGSVDWGQVAISGAFGLMGGGAMSLGREVLLAGAEGFVSSGYGYLTSPGPHTPGGLLRATTVNTVTSAATGGLLPPSATNIPTSRLDDMAPTPNPAAETFYRSMTVGEYTHLADTGKLAPSPRGETFISPDLDYVRKYEGVTVELTATADTRRALEEIGVRANTAKTEALYPDMPPVSRGWMDDHAQFKVEGKLPDNTDRVNIGLGRGAGVDTFNDGLLDWRTV